MARSPLTAQPSERSVFLDVPFDARYEPLFVGLVAAVTALGRIPRCVLEIQPSKDRSAQENLVSHEYVPRIDP